MQTFAYYYVVINNFVVNAKIDFDVKLDGNGKL